jgi:hypothetical protein
MSAWVDDDSPERERCSIALEHHLPHLGKLTELPTYVVVDTLGGHNSHVFSHGSDGEPFDLEAAATFAGHRNAGLKPGLDKAHRVFALVPVDDARAAEAAHLEKEAA